MITITYSDGRVETMTEQEFRARRGDAPEPARRSIAPRRPRTDYHPQGDGVDARFNLSKRRQEIDR